MVAMIAKDDGAALVVVERDSVAAIDVRFPHFGGPVHAVHV